jgi:type I restriction enzyme S subunit
MGNSDWEYFALGELTDNLDSVRVPVKESERKKGQYPYYGASGIIDMVDDYLFDGEYLLIAEDGENLRSRKTPIAFMAKGKFWVNNHAHIVQGNNKSDTRFLMYALQSIDISGYLTGSTIPKLTQDNLNRIPIYAPTLLEQRAIAGILGALDNKIEVNRRMNVTLETMARAVYQEMMNDEGGRINGGKEVTIGEVVTIAGGSTPSTTNPAFWNDGDIHWATPKDLAPLQSPFLLETNSWITELGLQDISSGLLPIGTVLLSSRAPIGYLAITQIPTAINQGFIAIKCTEEVPNYFVLNWLKENMEEIIGRANGTTFLEISKSNFRPMKMFLPLPERMKEFFETVQPLYQKVVANLKESRTLAGLRDSLLSKLMKGDIRISRE